MRRLLTISKYNLWIIGLYLAVFPLFFVFAPRVLRYDLAIVQSGYVALIIAVTFLIFYLLNSFLRFRAIGWQSSKPLQVFPVIVYALLFAVPEEMIFRGLIQDALQNSIHNAAVAVAVSSVIFGLAHLPNGAKGRRVKDWNWEFAAMAFFAGIPLGLIFALTDSLLVPTLLHAFFLIFFRLFTGEVVKG